MIGNTSYVHIGGWMINELGLGGTELLVYAVIYSFTNGTEDHCFHGSAGYLSEWCGISRRQVMTILKRLEDRGLINREEKIDNGVKFVSYFTGYENISQGDMKKLHDGGYENISHNNNRAIKKEKEDNINNGLFEDFWRLYPKKRKKNEARKKFGKIKDIDLEKVMSGLNRYLEYRRRKGTEMQYIPDPTTWINQERRNDELEDQSVKKIYKPAKLNEHLSFNDLI